MITFGRQPRTLAARRALYARSCAAAVTVIAAGAAAPALGATISDGAYIAVAYYPVAGGSDVVTLPNPPPPLGSAPTTSTPNYAPATPTPSESQTISTTSGPISASASANVSTASLSLSLNTGSGSAGALAEIWDTLSATNLPSGPSVNGGTVMGMLTLTVTTTLTDPLGDLTPPQEAVGLQLYNPSQFAAPPLADCGVTIPGAACSGFLNQASSGYVTGFPSAIGTAIAGPQTFSLPLTLGMLQAGPVSYTAEIAATNGSPQGPSTLTIDPSITLTGVYSGVTFSSDSGYNYTAAVPLPAGAWLLGSGLLGLFGSARRRARAWRSWGASKTTAPQGRSC